MESVILTEKNFNKLRDLVKKNKEKEIIFSSEDDELNRKVIEKLSVNILLIPLNQRKDYMKQRNSGFNEVIAKICKKKEIIVGIDFDELIDSKQKERIFSRLKQNIFLCNKNKVKMKFIFNKHKRSIYDIKSLGLVLGMPTWMVKDL